MWFWWVTATEVLSLRKQEPETSFDNILRDFGSRYVEGFTPPNFADLIANSPFSE